MSIKYLLIEPDEDGAPNTFMTEEQLQEWLKEERGEEWALQTLDFMDEEELLRLGRDQSYWGDKKRILFRVEFLKPRAKAIKTKWVVE